jgi:hypothetical protein
LKWSAFLTCFALLMFEFFRHHTPRWQTFSLRNWDTVTFYHSFALYYNYFLGSKTVSRKRAYRKSTSAVAITCSQRMANGECHYFYNKQTSLRQIFLRSPSIPTLYTILIVSFIFLSAPCSAASLKMCRKVGKHIKLQYNATPKLLCDEMYKK